MCLALSCIHGVGGFGDVQWKDVVLYRVMCCTKYVMSKSSGLEDLAVAVLAVDRLL